MRVFSYSRTMAGAALRLQQRQPAQAIIEAPKPERALVAAPVASNVPQCTFDNIVRLVIPRTEAQQIIAEIAHKHGLTYADILCRVRRRKFVAARHEAIAAVKHAKPMMSLLQLGRLFHRDHSSIVHVLRKMGIT